jgi:hypothetical protein
MFYTTDTLKRIKSKGNQVTRPTIDGTDSFPEVVELAKNCWVETPETRPTFSFIRRVIKSVKLKRYENA